MHIAQNVRNTPGNDLAVCAHPNGITFLSLAHSHAVFRETDAMADAPLPHATLSFSTGPGKSLLNAEFRKGRGPFIQPGQVLCMLTLSHSENTASSRNGYSQFMIASPVRGALMEVNPRLTGLEGAALLTVLRDEYVLILEMKAVDIEGLGS